MPRGMRDSDPGSPAQGHSHWEDEDERCSPCVQLFAAARGKTQDIYLTHAWKATLSDGRRWDGCMQPRGTLSKAYCRPFRITRLSSVYCFVHKNERKPASAHCTSLGIHWGVGGGSPKIASVGKHPNSS